MSTIQSTKPLTYLPLKYAKYAHYLYWVLQRVRNSEDTPEFTSAFDVISKKLYDETMMFTYDFPEQNAFYDLFISQEKDAAKAINDAKPKKKRTRKTKPVEEQQQEEGTVQMDISQENKELLVPPNQKKEKVVKEKAPPKEPKEKKEKIVKEKKEKVVKEKKEKKVDSLESNSNTDIIAQIVSRANSIDSDILEDKEATPVNVVNEKAMPKTVPVKVVKDKVKEKATPKVVKDKAPKTVPVKVVKDKKGNNILNEITTELVADFINTLGPHSDNDSEIILVDTEEEEQEEEELDLQVKEVFIDGVKFYQDDDGKIYPIN